MQASGSEKTNPIALEVQIILNEKAASTQAALQALQASREKALAAFAPTSPKLEAGALASAIAKAKESATAAAKAMGKASAELHSLNLSSMNENSYNNYEYDPWGRARYRAPQTDGNLSQTPEIIINVHGSAEFYAE